MKKMLLAIPVILAISAFFAFGASGVLAANSSHGSKAAASGSSDDIGARFAADIDQLVERVSSGLNSEHFGQAHFTGKVDSISGDVWMIAGKKVIVDSHTNLVQSPKMGDMVMVNASVQSDGSFLARVIKTITSGEENENGAVVFIGKVTAISGSDWTVGGKKVVTDSSTQIVGSPVVNDMVQVVAKPQSDGSFMALVIRKITPEEENGEEIVVTGKVGSFTSTSLVVGNDTFTLNSSTEIEGKLADGVMVRVEAIKETSGTLLARGVQVLNESTEGKEVGEDNEVNEGTVSEASESGESMEVGENAGEGEEVVNSPDNVKVPANSLFIGEMPGKGHGTGDGRGDGRGDGQ